MTKASELEKLQQDYEKLKNENAKIHGSLETILSQLKKLDINSIEEAETFILNKQDEQEKNNNKLNKYLDQIKNLLKN